LFFDARDIGDHERGPAFDRGLGNEGIEQVSTYAEELTRNVDRVLRRAKEPGGLERVSVRTDNLIEIHAAEHADAVADQAVATHLAPGERLLLQDCDIVTGGCEPERGG
jgi:hypothetical protein